MNSTATLLHGLAAFGGFAGFLSAFVALPAYALNRNPENRS